MQSILLSEILKDKDWNYPPLLGVPPSGQTPVTPVLQRPQGPRTAPPPATAVPEPVRYNALTNNQPAMGWYQNTVSRFGKDVPTVHAFGRDIPILKAAR